MMEDAEQPYLLWSREEADHQLSPSRYCLGLTPENAIQKYEHTIQKESERARELFHYETVSYGPTDKQAYQVFTGPDTPMDCPIFVFIHGGYWQYGSYEESSYMANSLVPRGVAVVATGYDIAPKANMEEMVSQIQVCLAAILKLAKTRGSRGVYVSGHSAGAQLAAMALTADWIRQDVDISLIKGAMLMSGIYDMRCLLESYVNDPIRMDTVSAIQNSPLASVDTISSHFRHVDILVTCAAADPPEFYRQTHAWYTELAGCGMRVRLVVVSGEDHFSSVEKMSQANSELSMETLKLMGIQP